MSIGTGVGGSDVIQGRIPLAQLGNPSQVQIIATSDVGGVVDVAGSTWVGLTLSSPSTTVQSVPAVSTLAVGVLLLAVFAVSMMAYRRRYARYHWLLIVLCLPVVLTAAWALVWTTVVTDAAETGNGGDIRQLDLAADSSALHIRLHTHIGTATPSNQAPTDIALSNASVAENATAAVIGNLTTTDPDSGDSHTYSVSDSRFEVVGNQLKLKAGQALDYETETSVTLTVTSTDSGGLTLSKDFTLTVTDDGSDNVTGKLNDTGITWGGNYPSGSNSDCSGTEIDAQDCSHGRDAAALAGTLSKVGGGSAGFDFTKLDSSGNDLAATATAWSCVRDNVTGLVWEVKDDNGGLHDKDNTYTWYNSDSSTNGGDAGTQNGGTCSGGGDCDTAGLVTAVNAAGLCGQNDWRVPAREELRSIVDYSRYNPAIDTDYFPNTQYDSSHDYGRYWSSSPASYNSYVPWGVDFYAGGTYKGGKNSSRYVRLVRGGQ